MKNCIIKSKEREIMPSHYLGRSMKRILALLIALIMMITLAASCAQTPGTTAATTKGASSTTAGTTKKSLVNMSGLYPISTESTALSLVVIRSTMSTDSENLWWWRYVNKKTNIKMTIKQIDAAAEAMQGRGGRRGGGNSTALLWRCSSPMPSGPG